MMRRQLAVVIAHSDPPPRALLPFLLALLVLVIL